MQIVIDIEEKTYKRIQALARDEYFEHDILCGYSMGRIANGKPLPKGHGDLISKEQAIDLVEFYQLNPQHFDFVDLIDEIKDEKPIIEADNVESESKELYTKVKDTSENHYYKENNDNSYPGYLCNEDGSVCR